MGKTKEVFAEVRGDEIARKETERESGFLKRNTSRTDDLKQRVIKAKKDLPPYFMGAFLHVFPEYQDQKGKSRVTNVLQLRVADEEITGKLEKLVNILNQK